MQETRVAMRYVGHYNPGSVQEFTMVGGYNGLRKALGMTREGIVEEVKASGLIGRGGAGFGTGAKWSFMCNTVADQKYLVCNADEGEPATNKDRVLMAGDPHSLIEGMAIAAYALGASMGYIYLRYEYPYIFPVLEQAIADAKAAGYLGDNILGTGFSFDIRVASGGGAYVCGEETALLESIEGKRGESRFKPPYPASAGLFGKPTVINNVETLVNVPAIILNGAGWYKGLGLNGAAGTKIYSLNGNLVNRGVYEFPEGVCLKDLIYEVGGGCPNGRKLLAVQTGGASGPIINADQINVPFMANADTGEFGASLGAGDVMVIDDSNDILEVVENLMEFFTHESCGKCTPCREGNYRLLQLIRKIRSGEGTMADLDNLEELSRTMMDCSLCGLGQASPTPVVSTLKNFRSAYLACIEGGVR